MRGNFIVSIIILLMFQFIILFVLQAFNIPSILISIISDLVFSIVFACLDFKGQDKLRNPAFHGRVATYFSILTIIALLLGTY